VTAGCNGGAHIAFPDLMGFGRHRMEIAASDLQDYCLYQIGAVQAFVRAAGATLAHVKPHGALYVMASSQEEVAAATAAALARIDQKLPLFLSNDKCSAAVGESGITVAVEGFPDIVYTAAGSIIIEPQKVAWDPDLVARRALRMVTEQRVSSTDPAVDVPLSVSTLCIHGDAPNAVQITMRTRQVLEAAGVRIASLNS